ncbi:MAG: hypothetical protein P1V51_08055 [Deltaproteobacteria bacterium]|nr:hypothetical protein [Deltaproteobacteria bacterium]
MPANEDFRDLFVALSDAGAEFLVVGAHAVMLHTLPRYTKELDVWVRPDPENATRVIAALTRFGAPLADLREDDLSVSGTIYQIGVEPNRIDIITAIDGVEFDEAWPDRIESTYAGAPIQLLGLEALIRNKRASGRKQDLVDLERLEARQKLDEA